MVAETDIFTAEEWKHLKRAAARIVEMWDAGRNLFTVDDLVDEAWLYKRTALLNGKTFIARELLWKRMLMYVSARVFDGMTHRKHWTFQSAWEDWYAPVTGPVEIQAVDDAEFVNWIAKGLTPHETAIIWQRLREAGSDRRWGKIAARLGTSECAVKLAYSHAIRKLRRQARESLEARLSPKSLNERDRVGWRSAAVRQVNEDLSVDRRRLADPDEVRHHP